MEYSGSLLSSLQFLVKLFPIKADYFYIYPIQKKEILDLDKSQNETWSVEDEEDQDQRHHGPGQDELLAPLAAWSVELLCFSHLSVNLQSFGTSHLKHYSIKHIL